MSYRAQKWAYGLRGLSLVEKAVLGCLAWHHNHDSGQCNPSSRLIAAEIGAGVSTVNKAINSLQAKGLVDGSYDPSLGRVYALAITEQDRLPESKSRALTEQPYKEQESRTEKNRGSVGLHRTPVPEDRSERMTALAEAIGYSDEQIGHEWKRFRLSALKKGEECADWLAAWEMWITGRHAPKPAGRPKPVEPTNLSGIAEDVAEIVRLMDAGWAESRLSFRFGEDEIRKAARVRREIRSMPAQVANNSPGIHVRT